MKHLFAAEAEDEECESGKTTSEAFCALPGSATFFSPSLSHFVLSIFPTSPPSLTYLFSLSHNYVLTFYTSRSSFSSSLSLSHSHILSVCLSQRHVLSLSLHLCLLHLSPPLFRSN